MQHKAAVSRLAVVTGAGSGLGRAIALQLAAGGASVGVVDIDAASASETARLIEAAGGKARSYRADASKAGAARASRCRSWNR